MKLEDLRRKIDQTDTQIVKLIAERLRIAEEIGKSKREHGNQIEDRERERAVLNHVKAMAQQENVSPEDVESVYRQIVSMSKGRQGITVAFQGEAGAYSEEAAFRFFGASILARPCESLEDVFQVVEPGEALSLIHI